MIIWGVAGRRTAQQSAARALRHPDEPWLWRPDWAEGSADPESKSQFLTCFLLGVLFVLVSAPALLDSKRELLERHNYASLIALIFPLAGLFLISHASSTAFARGSLAQSFEWLRCPVSWVGICAGASRPTSRCLQISRWMSRSLAFTRMRGRTAKTGGMTYSGKTRPARPLPSDRSEA